ncbi:endonuclease/exonuclease/phosphatase family protein [Lacticaseibacillus daqingensis]|uniref:endonuclease/exonuclease/phosphatase family protein n=1 Tax=Lacticaseibacillus daqingensis TaxID=2486014 RepID=UPI0013DD8873|nr:endonuclease/exonuclease/phosphatase family protein [Lacticaseibacillus daqingensis]
MRITTYNVRYDTPNDGDWRWPARRAGVLANLARLAPDIFTVEEALPHQYVDLNELPGYAHVGVPRDDGFSKGEATVIYYRVGQFDLLDSGHRWVAHTPIVPSTFPGTGNKRVFQWAHLRRLKDDQELVVVANHLDDWIAAARVLGVQQVTAFLAPYLAGGVPIIWCGDFNMQPGDVAYQAVPATLQDAALIAATKVDPFNGTWPDQETFAPVTTQAVQRLDFFFVNAAVRVQRYTVDTTATADGRYASDHFPVTLEVELGGQS